MMVVSPRTAYFLVAFGLTIGLASRSALADGSRFQPEFSAADCLKAWERGLSPCDTTPDTYVVIRKSTRALAWCESGRLIKVFEMGLGFSPDGDKQREGDGRTPIGTFYIPRRLPSSQFHKAFLISYPDVEDANQAMSRGSISRWQHRSILEAHAECREPPQQTSLGGLIEIHGQGGRSDWTLGCIAIDNAAIDKLWRTLDVGDSVVILP